MLAMSASSCLLLLNINQDSYRVGYLVVGGEEEQVAGKAEEGKDG